MLIQLLLELFYSSVSEAMHAVAMGVSVKKQ